MCFVKRFGFILFVSMLLSVQLGARNNTNRNYLSTWLGCGYTSLMYQIDNARPYGSIGGEVGLGYEVHHNSFIFTTGAEFLFINSTSNMDRYQTDREVKDSEGYDVVYKYNFYHFRERYLVGTMQLPLMFGGRSSKFYALGGIKVGFNLFGKASVTSEFETKGYYKQYIDEFENMQNHYYFDGYSASGDQKLELMTMNVSISGECGWFLQSLDKFKKPNPVGRISLFFDYGLPNMMDNSINEGDFLKYPRANPVDIEHATIMRSQISTHKRVNSLVVGLKATLLFQFGNKHSCNCIGTYYLRKSNN